MILSDKTIKNLLNEGFLRVENVENINVECASVDLTLGDNAKILFCAEPENQCINKQGIVKLDEQNNYRNYSFSEEEPLLIPPNAFLLATTKEKITLPKNIGAFVTGRSSIGRLGLFVENAGWVDPNFTGQITLELYNASGYYIELKPNRRVAQLIFVSLDSECENPYNGKYQNQIGATESRIEKDVEVPKKLVM